MKKTLAAGLAGLMAAAALAGCANGTKTETTAPETTAESKAAEGGKLSVVTTIFPEYDWVKSIAGDQAENLDITMLLDNGVDLHSYQPTTEDISKIASCDMFIYVGGESDGWVKDALAEATNKDMVVINLLETLGDTVKEEEVKEGMQADHDHEHAEGEEADHDHEHAEGEDADHDHEHAESGEAEHDHEHAEGEEAGHDHDHEDGEPEYDEHVWLSLKNAQVLVKAVAEGLEKIDAAHADAYKANLESYLKELSDLDAQYKETVDGAAVKTLLFGDRFPFRYMVDDYGMDYYAAFVGCSAETEASFETVVFLANKMDELGLKHVMTIENSDQKIANTIIENTKDQNMDILTLDSMQSTTSADVEGGETYLGAMQKNLEVLKKALN